MPSIRGTIPSKHNDQVWQGICCICRPQRYFISCSWTKKQKAHDHKEKFLPYAPSAVESMHDHGGVGTLTKNQCIGLASEAQQAVSDAAHTHTNLCHYVRHNNTQGLHDMT